MHRRSAALFLAAAMPAAGALAQEYSIISDSTVIGRNFGYVSGTPDPRNAENPEGLTQPGKLDAVFEAAVFFKNLELAGFPTATGIDGQTFFGFLAPVRMRYRADEKVTIEAGAVLGHNFGDDDELDIAEPLVRIVYEPWEKMYLIGGTIMPTHPMHDALMDDVQKFRVGAEQGLQVRADTEHWKQDSWINWRIREHDTTAEEFDVGNVTELRFGGFRGDGELIWSHAGGQRNASGRVENDVGGEAGLSFGIPGTTFSDSMKWLEDLRLRGSGIFSHDSTKADETGSGWEVALTMDTRPADNILLRFFASYFKGDNISLRRGDPLYSLDDYTQLGATAVFTLPGGLRAEAMAVYQVNEGHTNNYSFAVNLVWGHGFNIPLSK